MSPPDTDDDSASLSGLDDRPTALSLLAGIKRVLPELVDLERRAAELEEDLVYRFHHQSFKLYAIQPLTTSIVSALKGIQPGRPMASAFLDIIGSGTGVEFTPEHNRRWAVVTGPMLDAFWHARYFLRMAIKYGQLLEEPPRLLPSGWAALLELFQLR